MPKSSVRRRCYDAIIAEVKGSLAAYYQQFPDRAGDARSNDALERSLAGLERVLAILDGYEITELPTERQEPKDKQTGG